MNHLNNVSTNFFQNELGFSRRRCRNSRLDAGVEYVKKLMFLCRFCSGTGTWSWLPKSNFLRLYLIILSECLHSFGLAECIVEVERTIHSVCMI
jgi:hypothetical protein